MSFDLCWNPTHDEGASLLAGLKSLAVLPLFANQTGEETNRDLCEQASFI